MILSDRVDLHMPVFQLTEKIVFPRPEFAEANGLLAIGGDLSPERLLLGYRSGIFPWYSKNDPILWWFTSPRLVIFPGEFRIPKRLQRDLKKNPYRITLDHAFEQVITSCAHVRTDKGEETWITKEMQDAYCLLHKLGYAHSVECWQGDTLAGGLYGVSLDRVFYGESMFTTLKNGSKVALVALVDFLKKKGCRLIDCQMTTNHLLRFGAREISGRQFRKYLITLITTLSPDGAWHNDLSTGNRDL